MAKIKTITQQMNVDLSTIGACLSVALTLIEEIPANDQTKRLASLIEDAMRAKDRAFDHMCTIQVTLSAI